MTQTILATESNLQKNWPQHFHNLKSIKKLTRHKEVAQPASPALGGASAVMELAMKREVAEKLSRTSASLERVKEQRLGHRTGKPPPTQEWEFKKRHSKSQCGHEANWPSPGLYSGCERCA